MAANSLEGSRVVVVGGSSGIGKEVTRQAADAGAHVTIGSRSEAKLESAAKEIHGIATGVVDVTNEGSVRAFFDAVGPLDHLVVCPGDMATGSVYEMSMDDVRQCLSTKIIGQMLCVRYAGKKVSRRGSIALIAGGAGFKPYAGMSITAAANVGIAGMGRSLALELAPIRVNVIVGGMIDTPLWSALPDDARNAMFEETAKGTPVGRIGKPEDVAATVIHALENDFLDGAVVHVDGGIIL